MPTVMIVEDDIDLRGELADYLGTSGYRVTAVGSIAQAEQALTQTFDLLVLDINLPDVMGSTCVVGCDPTFAPASSCVLAAATAKCALAACATASMLTW